MFVVDAATRLGPPRQEACGATVTLAPYATAVVVFG
jgi:hypothetical protein